MRLGGEIVQSLKYGLLGTKHFLLPLKVILAGPIINLNEMD